MVTVTAVQSELKTYQKQLLGLDACVAAFLPGLGPDMVREVGSAGSNRWQIGNPKEAAGVAKSMWESESGVTHTLDDTVIPGCTVLRSNGATSDGVDLVPRTGLSGSVLDVTKADLGVSWVGIKYLSANTTRGRLLSWGDASTAASSGSEKQVYELNRGQTSIYGATMDDGLTISAQTGATGFSTPGAYISATSLNIRKRELRFVMQSLDPNSATYAATLSDIALSDIPDVFDMLRLKENIQGGRTPIDHGHGDHWFFRVPILESNFLPYFDLATKNLALEPDTPIVLEARP